jgi:hypothetical protein
VYKTQSFFTCFLPLPVPSLPHLPWFNNNNIIAEGEMISPLRMKRFLSELTLYDLGLWTRIDPARLSLIERGYKVPRPDEKERLANALRCNSSEIFPDEDESPGEEVI